MYGTSSWHTYSYAFGFLLKTGCDSGGRSTAREPAAASWRGAEAALLSRSHFFILSFFLWLGKSSVILVITGTEPKPNFFGSYF